MITRAFRPGDGQLFRRNVVIQPTAQFAGVVQIASAALQRHYSSLLIYFSHLSKNFRFD